MNYFCVTDIGLLREKNQDSFLVKENNHGDVLAIVCDGIGGGKAGEVASSEVVKFFDENFVSSGPFNSNDELIEYLNRSVALANRRVFELAKSHEEYSGMGTTLTGVLINKNATYSINIGDSRVYGFADKKIFHLTNDDTLVNQMLANGEITYEESLNHPKKHYLVKAVGVFKDVNADIHKVKKMDYLLICSDGLHGLLSEDEMMEIVYDQTKEVSQKVEELKDMALLKGGYDNITVVLIKC